MTARTFASLVGARAEDDNVALRFGDRTWSWREVVSEARLRAGLAESLRRPGPWHVGLFLENTAEHLFWWLGAALSGITVVGLNPTRRGPELGRDVAFTDCQLLVVDAARAPLLRDVPLDLAADRVLHTDASTYHSQLAGSTPSRALPEQVRPDTTLSLIFTSGTTADPKAVICSQQRMGWIALQQQERRGLTAQDTFYVAMPMFHSNALMAGVAPAVSAGGTIVLRRRFSASGFLPDVRRYGVTYFNYVGKPLHYILATPERPDDADNPLRTCFGNEADARDMEQFARRFGCQVVDSYGSSEGEIAIVRVPGTPPGSLGVAPEGTVVVDPETLEECPPARFDDSGRLLNAAEATGQIVNKHGAGLFEGYYRNPAADAARLRHGWTWSGDLGYRDADGFFYFAGRTDDWLRVDGENVAAAPVERLLARFDDVAGVAVVATPDEHVGDQLMAVLELLPGRRFDPDAFAAFLAAQDDLATTWVPRYVRVVERLPRTATNKLLKRALDRDPSRGEGTLLVRRGKELRYDRAAQSMIRSRTVSGSPSSSSMTSAE